MANGKQAVYSGFSPKYAAPFDARVFATSLTDLVARNTRFNYANMFVFIMDTKQFYYLRDNQIGNDISHWQILETSQLKFENWQAGTFTKGTGISVGSNFYISKQNTSSSPTDEPTHWLELGTTDNVQVTVTDTDVVNIPHTLNASSVTIYDNNGDVVEADVRTISVTEYQVRFSENFSGTIIVK